MGQSSSSTPEVDVLRKSFEALQSRLNAAKIAYLNRTAFDDRPVSYESLKGIAEEVIEANYDLQRACYGEIRLKLSVPKLLRRGR